MTDRWRSIKLGVAACLFVLALGLTPQAIAAWVNPELYVLVHALQWGGVFAVSVIACMASAWFWLSEANTWAQATVSWRHVALHLIGFLLTVWYTASAIALAVRELGR